MSTQDPAYVALREAYVALREETERLRELRGRCEKHKDMPGPSLWHDCCESERLRGLCRERLDDVDSAQAERNKVQEEIAYISRAVEEANGADYPGAMPAKAEFIVGGIKRLHAELMVARGANENNLEGWSQDRAGLSRKVAGLEAELAEWADPDSPRRQALMEETILALGDGQRSEVDLRESQLSVQEAVNASLRAELAKALDENERLRERVAELAKEGDHLRHLLRTGSSSDLYEELESLQELSEDIEDKLNRAGLPVDAEHSIAERFDELLRYWIDSRTACREMTAEERAALAAMEGGE